MTPQEIRDAIVADPAIHALVPDTEALAVALSAGRTKVVSTLGSYALILATVPDGGGLLNIMEMVAGQSPTWKWAWKSLQDGRFDFGLPQAISGWDALAEVGATEAQIAALKAIPLVPDPVGEFEIRCAIYAPDGSLLV